MPSWKQVHWGDLATLEYGKSLRGYSEDNGPYEVFGTNGPIGRTSIPLFDRSTVIVGRKGAYRGIHYSPEPCFVIDTAFYLNPTVEFDMRWAYYELLTHDINAMDSGSAIPSTSRSDFYSLPVCLPPLEEQRVIAHILGSLDHKIELNRQMNQTLDEIARTLFTSWFVDFDPVRAKAEGRRPEGMDAETAALFPNRFVDSELGPVPDGWCVARLDEIILLQRGFDLPAKSRTSGAVPVVAASGPSGSHSEPKVKGPGVVTGRSGVIGNVYYIGEDFWPLNTTLWVKEFRHTTPIYAFMLLRALELSRFGTGSAVPTLNRNHIHGNPVIKPDMGIIERYQDAAQPFIQLARQNREETQTIAELRDALLPELLSGRVRVHEAKTLASQSI